MTNAESDDLADRVVTLLAAGRTQLAIEICKNLCENPQATAGDWFLYGRVSADTGDIVTGLSALSKAVELDPGFIEARLAFGDLLTATGDYTAAIAQLRKVAELNSYNPNVWLKLGVIHSLANDPVSAEEHCRRSLQIQPNSANALFQLSVALRAQGKLGESAATLEATVNIDPQHVMGWTMLAQVRATLKKLPEASIAAAHALSLDPNLGEMHNLLGDILEKLGDKQQALKHYDQATKLLPNDTKAHLSIGRILLEIGDYVAATKYIQATLELNPTLAQAHLLMGDCMRAQRLRKLAADCYCKALSLDSNYLPAHYRLAVMMMEAKHKDDSAKHFKEILRLNPNDAQARHLLAAQLGETPPSAPHSYIRVLFDGYADQFDSRLTGKLNYRTPELLYELVRPLIKSTESLDVIDLGCGTGLCAPHFRKMARRLHGVDIAPRMIEKARERNLYDSLEVDDIAKSLRSKSAAWDLAIAADVFVYVGDLREVFSACSSALKPGGLFAFSIEAYEEGDTYKLRQTGRYAHSLHYIQSLSATFGLCEVLHRSAILRRDNNEDIDGYLILLAIPPLVVRT